MSNLIIFDVDGTLVGGEHHDWACFDAAIEVEFTHLQIPVPEYQYHYRLLATIALAGVSRQVGRRPAVKVRPVGRPPIYDDRLVRLAEAAGQIVSLEELADY